MRYFLRLQYNGTKYHGWQIQPEANSIQKDIEKAISMILSIKTNVVGCGRTDTGVHANEYFLHFDVENTDVNTKLQDDFDFFLYKLNGILANDIKIMEIFIPDDQEMHARFSAKNRTYKYIIINEKDPFLKEFAYRYQSPLDINKMNEACKLMMTYNDFSSFCKSGSDNTNNNCIITEAYWKRNKHVLSFTITANRFLRNMVRAICGTMIEVGSGKLDIEGFRKVIEAKNRSEAGFSVPAKGLSLWKINY